MTTSSTYARAIELTDMLSVLGMKTSPLTFLQPASGTQQFQVFLKTAVTLFEKCGRSIAINKYEDPVSLCTNLISAASALDLSLPAIPPALLRTGSGDAVVALLHALASRTLANQTSAFPSPRVDLHDGNGETADLVEASEAAESEPFGAFPSFPVSSVPQSTTGTQAHTRTTDTDWLQEVERAGVRLSREASETLGTSLGAKVSELTERLGSVGKERRFLEPAIGALAEEIGNFMETAQREEKTAQELFHAEGYGERARMTRRRLQEVTAEINAKQDKVHSLEEELNYLDGNLETAKNELDDWSDVATDTQPVVKIKEAIKKIQDENKAMDLRIAVLNHTLYEARTNRLFLQ